MQLENFCEITVSISCLKMSTLPQNDQMDYFHPFSKLGPGLKYHNVIKAVEVMILDIYLRPSKWSIFAFFMKFTDSW